MQNKDKIRQFTQAKIQYNLINVRQGRHAKEGKIKETPTRQSQKY